MALNMISNGVGKRQGFTEDFTVFVSFSSNAFVILFFTILFRFIPHFPFFFFFIQLTVRHYVSHEGIRLWRRDHERRSLKYRSSLIVPDIHSPVALDSDFSSSILSLLPQQCNSRCRYPLSLGNQ